MRFTRRPRAPYLVTDRKRAAAVLAQRRERDATPLLAALIAERQPDIDTLMTERSNRWEKTEQDWRDTRAAQWRKARAAIASLPADEHDAVLRYWNTHRWLPGNPSYLLGCLHEMRTGRLVIQHDTLVRVRVTITAAEATAIDITRKPFASGWLNNRL